MGVKGQGLGLKRLSASGFETTIPHQDCQHPSRLGSSWDLVLTITFWGVYLGP